MFGSAIIDIQTFILFEQVTGTAFTDKKSTKDTVERLAVSLKSQVAAELANAIDTRVEELQEKWQSLDQKLSERKTGKL